MSDGIREPVRAYRLTLRLDADSREDLAQALRMLAVRANRDELTSGVSGGYSSGYTYELLHNPRQTHDGYFDEVHRYLEGKSKQGAGEG